MMATKETTGPRRRPGSGGYARGEETRARIIAAAIEVFGQEGFERASTRQIAKDAGVNPPALQYYFDSKDGLHRACAQFIIDQVSSVLPAAMAAAAAASQAKPKRALNALCDLLETVFDISIMAKQIPALSRFMARAQMEPETPAAQYIREQVSRPLHAAAARLVGIIIGRPADDEETKLRASLVLSQLSAFHLHRANTLAILDWPDFAGKRGDTIKALLRAHTRAALGYPE
ncbi:MAG TPA: CerR family C-terminal domain-containing protein [Stellaceae bacterium]|nr:CerR family C-terminal domain-containing protein [Stellaceae bacterium]